MSRFVVLVLASLAGACISQPSFVLDESDTTSPSTRVSGEGDDEMVLIAATTFPSAGALAPNAPGGGGGDDDDEGEKGKGRGRGGAGGGDDGGNPGGGNPGGANADAGTPPTPPPPAATTTSVPAFWIDTREVSAASYSTCVRAGGCSQAGADAGCNLAGALGAHPANCVTIDQARAFCGWRGKRLVRNDEWTAASAGAQLRAYPWGNDAPSATRLNACGSECGARAMYAEDDGYAQTAPRGSYPAGRTPEGVWDLAGNVAEWVDLAGTSVTRGGSFTDFDPASVSAAGIRPVNGAAVTVGFRCAKDG